MISELVLENFRQHELLKLEFPPDAQLIVMSGPNGSGKTSILEAILYAFTGDSRSGRHGLDAMVRTGAEIEGMKVICTFTANQNEYTIERRRSNGVSSAVLYADGEALVEGAGPVSAELSKILGLPMQAFKFAVMAKQGELQGLVAEKPASRSAIVSKLAGLDAVKAAAEAVYGTQKATKESIGNFPPYEEASNVAARIKATKVSLTAVSTTAAAVAATLAALEGERVSLREATEAAAATAAKASYLNGRIEALQQESAAVQQALEELGEPQRPISILRPSSQILGELRALEQQTADLAVALDRAASQEFLIEKLATLTTKREACVEELAALSATLSTENLALELAQTLAVAQDTSARLQVADATVEHRRAELTSVNEDYHTLEGVCPTCGQDITPETAHRLAAASESRRLSAEAALQSATASAAELRSSHKELKALVQDLTTRKQSADERVAVVAKVAAELEDVDSKIAVYTGQLVESPAPAGTVDDLEFRRSQLMTELSTSTNLEAETSRVDRLLADKLKHEQRLMVLTGELQSLAAQLHEVQAISVLSQFEQLKTVEEKVAAEQTVLNTLTAQVSTSTTQLHDLKERLADAKLRSEQMAALKLKLEVSALAKEALDTVHVKLSTELRPSLEATLTLLLEKMSYGRFTKVSLSDDFEVSVEDGTVMRTAADLSGGEKDLVALAFRLALTEAVKEVKGSTVAGFVILDEVFGFQDSARRAAIMESLKELRTVYGQVFAVSHVGGLEDYADMVLDIAPVYGDSPDITVTR